MLKPEEFFFLLSDETRLRCMLLLHAKNELCVCDFSYALQIIQPKISRHLAILKAARVLSDRRTGTWAYYSIQSNLPTWASLVLSTFAKETRKLYSSELIRLNERDRSGCEKSIRQREAIGHAY
jgi:ArsR family transcriptional regulator